MTWPQDAYVGQKIVCVDDRPTTLSGRCELKLNEVYEISRIDFCKTFIDFKPRLSIWLKETGERLCPRANQPIGFNPNRFRPVQENKKGMEMLTALLNPINHKVLEDA